MTDDRLLKAAEVAELLGVPKSWVLAQARTNAIPHVRLGRYVRFRSARIDEWLAELEQQPTAQAVWRKHHPTRRA